MATVIIPCPWHLGAKYLEAETTVNHIIKFGDVKDPSEEISHPTGHLQTGILSYQVDSMVEQMT